MMLEKRERVSVELREHRAANQSQTSVSPTHRPKFLTQIQGRGKLFSGNSKKSPPISLFDTGMGAYLFFLIDCICICPNI